MIAMLPSQEQDLFSPHQPAQVVDRGGFGALFSIVSLDVVANDDHCPASSVLTHMRWFDDEQSTNMRTTLL